MLCLIEICIFYFIEYYQKGNNNSQIATLCGCSRTVVWEVLNRFNKIKTLCADIQKMSEEELRILLFSERVKKGNGYLIPDFKWEEFQMRKHQSSLRLCWRRYCKRAVKQNLKAYSWASFCFFYGQYRKPCSDEDDPNDMDDGGIMLGENKANGFPFIFNIWKRGNLYQNSNGMIIGKSGSGKSFFLLRPLSFRPDKRVSRKGQYRLLR